MSKPQRNKQGKLKIARLEIVAQMYKRGHSYRQIQAECLKRLELKAYSLQTVHADIQSLLEEWRSQRINDMDAALQLELECIDDTVRELWRQWEKSKEDWFRTTNIRKGAPKKQKDSDKRQGNGSEIETYGIEEMRTNMIGLGDPRYISEIRAQLMERRKLLGLYAPEKKDIATTGSFAHYLVESGLLDAAEQQSSTEETT